MALSFERIEVMLLIATVVAMVARRVGIPYSVGLLATGFAVAAAHLSFHVEFSSELIMNALLPPLIFEAALHLKWEDLSRNRGPILVLVTVGVILTAAIIAGGVRLWLGWPWQSAILIGVLIAATDPVAVLSLFKDLGVTGRFRLLIEAESLLNDAVVAVIYGILVKMGGGGISVGSSLEQLAVLILGGIGCGLVGGWFALLLSGRTGDHLIELTLSSVAAYGSYFLAEHIQASGILAALTAGLIIGNRRTGKHVTPRGQEAIDRFWEFVCFLANSVIFLVIGSRLAVEEVGTALLAAALVVVLCLVGRAVTVYGCCSLFARGRHPILLRDQHILFWGGLRGALALALATALPQEIPQRQQLITVLFAVVAFSVVVQGTTIRPLLKYLGVTKPEKG